MTETRKTVTVLFTDLTGFTSLTERLDPEAVRGIVTRFGDEMRAVAERHGGTVEKFIGDAVMTIFGVPTVHEDDALRAVRAAAEMHGALEALNAHLGDVLEEPLRAHTGIDTGEVVVSDDEGGRLATGNAVNVAARLQSAAGPGEILIGATTYRLVRDAVDAEALEPLDLKGKSEKVDAYRLVAVDPAAPGYLRRLDAPLIGRDAELRSVLSALERAASEGRCQLVTVMGPPGVGKSRLAAEVIGRVEDRCTVLVGRCLPYGEGITFWPIAEALKSAAGIRDDDTPEEAVARLGTLVHGEDAELVRDRVAGALGLRSGSGSLQETFWAVRRLFESLAETRPLVFLVDDIHWAEPSLFDLLEYLVEFAADRPMTLLCTARPDIREARPDWERLGELVTLHPLTEVESERLVRNLLGAAGVPGEVLRVVAATAEGNPLFLEELLRKLIDDEVLVRANSHWEARGEVDVVSAPTVSAVLAARIDALDGGERSTIQCGSVVGRIFYWGAVEALAPEPERPSVGSHLRTLVRKELIRPESSSFAGEDAFAFSHILVRDAAYDSTPKAVRATLHEGFARWLEDAAGERLPEYEEIVGYHLEQAVRHRASIGAAGERDAALASEAGRRLAGAGMRANARGDTRAAVNLLERAIALLPERAPERSGALNAVGPLLMEVGRFGEGVAALEEAMRLAHLAGDVALEQVARARRVFVRVHGAVLENLEAEWAEVQDAVRILEEVGDNQRLGEALAVLGAGRFYRGDVQEALRFEERAREHALIAGDERTANWAARWTCMIMMNGDTPVHEAIPRVERFLAEAPRESNSRPRSCGSSACSW